LQDHEDLALLTKLAEAAGDIAMRHFRNEPAFWEKDGGQGPVSEADLEIDALLVERMKSARPDYAILSEESENDDTRISAQDVFIIDPIDGTRAFLGGTSAFSHALAVVRDGVVRAAVVFLPAQERFYAAVAGAGATLNGDAIAARQGAELPYVTILANKAALASDAWSGAVPEVKRAYRPSLAYRFCLVAQGRFDGLITLRDAWEWDTAAGTLIAQEAGATVTDGQGNALRFNSPSAKHKGCITAPPALHAQLMAQRTAAAA